jgi:hypothetical protein
MERSKRAMQVLLLKWTAVLETACGVGGLIGFYVLTAGDSNMTVTLGMLLVSLCTLGIYAGLELRKRTTRGLLLSRLFFGMQVISITGPILHYVNGVGLGLWLGTGSDKFLRLFFGLDFGFNLADPGLHFGFSVNIVALAVFWFLMKDSVDILCAKGKLGDQSANSDDLAGS